MSRANDGYSQAVWAVRLVFDGRSQDLSALEQSDGFGETDYELDASVVIFAADPSRRANPIGDNVVVARVGVPQDGRGPEINFTADPNGDVSPFPAALRSGGAVTLLVMRRQKPLGGASRQSRVTDSSSEVVAVRRGLLRDRACGSWIPLRRPCTSTHTATRRSRQLARQPVDPSTGRLIPNSIPFAHAVLMMVGPSEPMTSRGEQKGFLAIDDSGRVEHNPG